MTNRTPLAASELQAAAYFAVGVTSEGALPTPRCQTPRRPAALRCPHGQPA